MLGLVLSLVMTLAIMLPLAVPASAAFQVTVDTQESTTDNVITYNGHYVGMNFFYDRTAGQLYGNRGKGLLWLGFDLDTKQDVWYSAMYAWQRGWGFGQTYDNLAPYVRMYYRTLRFTFDYNGKNWLIQCWKGRYGITTGAEIGVYNKEAGSSRSIYSTVTDDERLELGMVVHDKTKLLFERPVQTHWWMTGFLLNYYTDHNYINVKYTLRFPDTEMLNAFTKSVDLSGYDTPYAVEGNEVRLYWYGRDNSGKFFLPVEGE